MDVVKRNKLFLAIICALLLMFVLTSVVVLTKYGTTIYADGFITPTLTTLEVEGAHTQKNVVLDGTSKKVDIAVNQSAESYTIIVEADKNVDIILVDESGDTIELVWDETTKAYVFDSATSNTQSIDGYSVVINGQNQTEVDNVVKISVKANNSVNSSNTKP
jgi:hypothetical protein